MLRSTNNVVVWLSPSSLVAKIARDRTKDLGYELSWAKLLVGVGAPVVPPAPRLGAVVHRIADRDVTFWEHVPDDVGPLLSSVAIASALQDLHAAFGELAPATRTVAGRLAVTIDALDRESFAAGLSAAERHLLARAMRTAADAVSSRAATVHGSAHRFNVLAVNGTARFIDLETVAGGPIEWDLAHLEPDVAEAYQLGVDTELLEACRVGVSAFTAAQCWHDRERGPDMMTHARHHLEVVRARKRLTGCPKIARDNTSKSLHRPPTVL
jgi:hypothetical protein